MEVDFTALLCLILCFRHCCSMAQCVSRGLQINWWKPRALWIQIVLYTAVIQGRQVSLSWAVNGSTVRSL